VWDELQSFAQCGVRDRNSRCSMNTKLAWIFMCLPVAGTAQQWAPAPGCEPFLTVQANECQVVNLWTCSEAPEGYVYRSVHEYGERVIADVFDAERNWVATEFADGWRETLLYPMRDPISITDLAENGFDTIDFDLLSNPSNPDDPVTFARVRGADIMLGETVEIDGETLEKSRYLNTFANADGVVTGTGEGEQYYSPRWNMLLSGVYSWTDSTGRTDFDNTPITFLEPGEDGFGSIQGVHGCDGDTVEDDAPKADTSKGNTSKETDGAKSN